MSDSQVIAFTFIAAALTVSPGPDTMLVMRNVLRRFMVARYDSL